MNNIVIVPPNILKNKPEKAPMIFLAGSIEMGVAEPWQDRVIEYLETNVSRRLILYNPRRPDWDASWQQEASHPQFSQQVRWELQSMEKCDLILMYFDPNTKSPISLLELGLYARTGKLIVCCPDKFWRQGNVDILCDMYDMCLFDNLDDMLQYVVKLF